MTNRHPISTLLKTISFWTIASFIFVVGTAPLHAQQDSGEELMLEEVIVTAQKREQTVQEIPISITAISAGDLIERSVLNTGEALLVVPNLHFGANVSGNPRITIRGVGTNTNNIGIESGVGMQVDGVPLGRPIYFQTALMDVERMEVLRGPQGTLYGKNTTGGLINIITGRPQQEFSASGDVTFGNYDLRQLRGHVTGGFGDDGLVSARLAVTAVKRDGWAEDRNPDNEDFQGQDFAGVRGHLLITPSDRLSLLFTGFYSNEDVVENFQDIQGGALYALDGSDGWDRSLHTSEENYFKRDVGGGSMNIEYEFGNGMTFTSVTGYLRNNSEFWNDQDYSLLDVLATGRREEQQQFSQEFRIGSNNDGAFSWTAGVFYFDQTQSGRDHAKLGTDTLLLLGIPLPVTDYTETSTTTSDIDTESIAGFVAGSWNINEKWTLEGGVRLTKEKKKLDYEQVLGYYELFPGFNLGIVDAFAANVPLTHQELSDTEPSGDLSLSYAASDAVNIYGRYSHGFKAGGFDSTTSATSDPGDLSFSPEFVDSFELGIKTYLADNRVQLNAAVFYLDWKDKQEQFFNGANFITSNAASASNKGAELELVALLTDALRLTGSVGYQDGKYEDFLDSSTGVDRSGNTLVGTPDWSGMLALDYNHRSAGGWGFYLRGEAVYRDDNFTDQSNSLRFVQVSHTEINARIGISSPNDTFNLSVWGKNLTEEDYIHGGFEFFGTEYASVSTPRLWGVELRVRL